MKRLRSDFTLLALLSLTFVIGVPVQAADPAEMSEMMAEEMMDEVMGEEMEVSLEAPKVKTLNISCTWGDLAVDEKIQERFSPTDPSAVKAYVNVYLPGKTITKDKNGNRLRADERGEVKVELDPAIKEDVQVEAVCFRYTSNTLVSGSETFSATSSPIYVIMNHEIGDTFLISSEGLKLYRKLLAGEKVF